MSFKKKFLKCIGRERQIEIYFYFYFFYKSSMCLYRNFAKQRKVKEGDKKVLTLWLSTASPC